VPANAPAEAFWSVTAYEVSTHTLIYNKYEIADRSSRMDFAMNPDGSVDIYFGPGKSEGDKTRNYRHKEKDFGVIDDKIPCF
jgi:hypothetical protein